MLEIDPITDVLLCSALGLGALAVGFVSLLANRRRLRVGGFVLPLALCILLAVPAVGMATAGGEYSSLVPLVLLSSFFGVVAFVRTPLADVLARRIGDVPRWGWVPSTCLVVLGLGLVGWQFYALDRERTKELADGDAALAEGRRGVEPVPGWVVWTDKGRGVQMMRSLDDPESVAEAEPTYIHSLGLDYQVIQTAPADVSYNCHGWVFNEGKGLISGESVDTILADNRYRIVPKPGVGDLVVFRDSAGKVSHSALVRALLDDGGPLLESKWGVMGRYIHTLEHHAYQADEATFYTCLRAGHRLRASKDIAGTVPRE